MTIRSWMKKVYKYCYQRRRTRWNFKRCWYRPIRQRALVFTVMWFEAHAQKKHSCSRSTWWPTWQTGLSWLSEELQAYCGHEKCRQTIPIDRWLKCTAKMWCPGNWCHKFASGRDMWRMTIEVDDKVYTTRFEELIQTNRHVTWWRMAPCLGLSYGTLQVVVGDVLQHRKDTHVSCLEETIVSTLFHRR